MGVYDLFRKIAQSDLTQKEREVNQLKYDIISEFEDSPSFETIYINGSLIATEAQIVESSLQINKTNYNIKTILMKPNVVLKNGDLIQWNSQNWLSMGVGLVSNAYYKGTIVQCEYTISHYNKNGILLEIPIVFDNGVRLYSLGQDENKYISTVNNEVIAYIPDNDDTSDIKEDQIYTIGRKNYEIKSIQDIVIPGLLVLKMKVTTAEVVVETHDYNVIILNGEEVILGATEPSTLQLDIQCKLDGVVVANPEVTYESSDELSATVSDTGLITVQGTGSCDITVTYGDATAIIHVTTAIHVTDVFDITITPADTNMYVNKTQTFTAKVTNNGVDMPYHTVLWSLVNVDGSSNEYCTYVVDDRDITVTSKNNINKQIKIKSTLLADSNVFEERTITFRSLV